MEYRLAGRDEVVGNYSSMASPPDVLSTHYCRSGPVPKFAKLGEAGPKLIAHGVVRIIVKAPIFPKCIHVRGHVSLLATEASQLDDMFIANL
jgi:hypothetical protein